MLRRVFRAAVPGGIRGRFHWELYRYFQREILAEEYAKRVSISEALPRIELQWRHIDELKVVPNRQEFLQFMPRNSVVVEVGVERGDFSTDILAITQPERLHLIDWWEGEAHWEGIDGMMMVENRFQHEIASGQVVINRGLSHVILEEFTDGYFDWVYLDTDHAYETVSKELQVCSRKVKAGGIIAGHDYVNGQITRCVKYGVVEAVNEFCVNHEWKMILMTHEPHRHLSWALHQIGPNHRP